ncbi:MAG: VCBS repeat-containing protein [Planctomycetota bacterium]|nr:VCBS repeat-containing protein [Planctomycetota bacterium]
MSVVVFLTIVGQAGFLDAADTVEAPKWRKHVINDQSPFEAAGVADFNGDGKLDVFSGDSWYAAPNWNRHKVRDVPRGTNPHYYEDFADLPVDVNGDGRMDILTCAYFSRRIAWVEQPADPTQPWTEHTIDTPGSMETGSLVNLYGDGTPVFVPNVGGQMVIYELKSKSPKVEWNSRQLAPEGAGHGIGHGDINGDGRIDLITPKGWYEQPAERAADWKFHPELSLGTASIEIIGHDFDGDGDTDIVWGVGHEFGLHWVKQSKDSDGKRTWTKEDIDNSFSQAHTLHLADFDGDGQMEFVTGKRIYAHPSEAGATDEPCVFIFKFDRKSAKWVKTVVYQGEKAPNAPSNAELRDALKDFPRGSAGTGLQMAVRDLDGDGDIDIVAPGKSGLYWFENPRITKPAPAK